MDVSPARLPCPPYTLRVADLRVRWPGGGMLAIEDEFVLPSGSRLALVGVDRFRASALSAVLLGFLDYDGIVTLNDVQLSDLAGDDVRTVIGLCARDARLVGTTVADNVRLSRPDATDEQVACALRRAGVDPRTRVADGAVAGYERQRIALARALLADVPILVVDESAAYGEVPSDRSQAGEKPSPGIPQGEEPSLGKRARHDEDTADLIAAAGDRTLLFVTGRAAVPGAAPVLGRFDEVRVLSG